MAYTDYGAFVYCNEERREDKENVALFLSKGVLGRKVSDDERLFVPLGKAISDERSIAWVTGIHHGIIGDDDIRVICHGHYLPEVYERLENGTIQKVDIKSLSMFSDKAEIPEYNWGAFSFEYRGYSFIFTYGDIITVEMTEPEGTFWVCNYGYHYGAGFDDTIGSDDTGRNKWYR